MTPAPLVILDEIDSTNAEARRLAEAGELGPRWIVARRQTAGRGRRGRAWIDKPGNLAATLLIRVQVTAREAAQTTFIAALAVADLMACEELCRCAVGSLMAALLPPRTRQA